MNEAEKVLDNIINDIPSYCKGNQLKTFTYIYYKVALMLEYDDYACELVERHLTGYERERAHTYIIDPASSIECIRRGRAICSGYASVLEYLLNKVGILTKFVNAQGIHVWNQVLIDGKWYNCDLTNDRDFIIDGLKCPHFLTSNADDCNFKLRPPTSEFNECNETISEELQEQLIEEVREYFRNQQKIQSSEIQENITNSKFGFIAKIKNKLLFAKGGRNK